jgi:hypothetical protein
MSQEHLEESIEGEQWEVLHDADWDNPIIAEQVAAVSYIY